MERRDTTRYKNFTRRAALLGGGQLLLLSALAGRLYYLQVLQSDQYTVLADENRISLRLLAPPRGRILDRFGVELANNRQNYRVVIIREQTDSVERTLAKLSELVGIDDYQKARVTREIERKRKFVPVMVAENLTWDEFSRVNVLSPDLPGIQLDVGETRDYPFGETLAHVIGYVAAVSEQDLDDDPLLELPGFRIGKNGIEKTYDAALRGKAGDSRVEVNAYGRVIRELARNDGQAGNDLVLTIDSELQKFSTQRLAEEESAAAVVLDAHSGDVLAMVSTPSFDPNAFNVGVTADYWRSLSTNPRHPLTNKAIAGTYPPGSTFKMMVALAGLESGAISADHHVTCHGQIAFGNTLFHCWKKGGHGTMNITSAIEQSCDVFFYDVSNRANIDRIADVANRFGLGQACGIDLPGERPGLIPSRAWKLKTRKEAWHPGETLSVGIGQGYVSTTPLQLAVMAARIANGGYKVMPRLVRESGEVSDGGEPPTAAALGLPSLKMPATALDLVTQGMKLVVGSPRGTAYRARIKEPEFAMAGKTGSSQVRRITKREREAGLKKQEQLPWEDRDHGLFVCFAPVGNPRYACAVVVEHGAHGANAALLARDIMSECQRLDPSRRAGRGRFAAGQMPPKSEI